MQDLLEDKQYLTMRRHLRAIYLNPFTGKADWEPIVSPDGHVKGVRAQVPSDAGVQVRVFVHVRDPG